MRRLMRHYRYNDLSPMRRQILLDCGLLFLLSAALIWPLFAIHYLDDWMSIEGSFIGDVRYIRDHFPHPKWHALWYCGTRFDYIYPPLTRFGSAIVSRVLGVVPAQAYHIYTGFFYCMGMVGTYLLVHVWTNRRWNAWFAALAVASISPVFAFLPEIRADSAHLMPARLYTLTKWGEGPHISAFSMLPFAVGLLYPALKRQSWAAWAGCAVASALVVSNNLYGAAALGILFPIAVWSISLSEPGRQVWLRAAGIVALSCGLCAWWFTPSFVLLTARNLQLVAPPGNVWSRVLSFVLVGLFLAVSWHWGRSRPDRAWLVFLSGSLFSFAVVVLAGRWADFRIAGDSIRFMAELDLLLVLVIAEGIHWLASMRRRLAVAASAAVLGLATPYLLHAWAVFPVDSDYKSRVEYRLTDWIARNLPGSRTYAAGSVCFWYTVWRDQAEAAGGSAQGMQTLLPALLDWQLKMGDDAERDIAWMVATGADAILTHEAGSQEVYRVIRHPRRFMGRLPVIFDRDGDVIYRVPRRFPGLARVVSEARMATLPAIPWSNENREQLQAYAAAVEESPTQVAFERASITEMRLRVRTRPGESILVQENWDPGWRADDRGERLDIRVDLMGFMRIQTPPGEHDIRVIYDWPLDSRLGQTATLISLVLVAGVWIFLPRSATFKM